MVMVNSDFTSTVRPTLVPFSIFGLHFIHHMNTNPYSTSSINPILIHSSATALLPYLEFNERLDIDSYSATFSINPTSVPSSSLSNTPHHPPFGSSRLSQQSPSPRHPLRWNLLIPSPSSSPLILHFSYSPNVEYPVMYIFLCISSPSLYR
ncbi:hypothetical protein BDW69DRAFT_90705 [Aspergillus filifer]